MALVSPDLSTSWVPANQVELPRYLLRRHLTSDVHRCLSRASVGLDTCCGFFSIVGRIFILADCMLWEMLLWIHKARVMRHLIYENIQLIKNNDQNSQNGQQLKQKDFEQQPIFNTLPLFNIPNTF
ncbi:hypothetical protein FGO68_gene15626 [Halteria grandinella]|uniref:Uncharacterized protein n=1 Tax=Halteria grandinella TaxID=5974 RepID=A0A8J8P9J1_HALGN|nr:hypothetical protein FGO68_gene15626 [Halteria grandinella]